MIRNALVVLVAMTATGVATAAPRRAATRSGGASASAVRQARSWYAKDMEKDIRDGETPHWVVHNANGKVTKDVQYDYGKGKSGIMNVTGLGKSGTFKVVALLPVSGHVSWAKAQEWARTNRYNLTLEGPSGATTLHAKVASTGLVTAKAVSLRLKKGPNTFEFWADGSAGAGGYREGRSYVITWDGK